MAALGLHHHGIQAGLYYPEFPNHAHEDEDHLQVVAVTDKPRLDQHRYLGRSPPLHLPGYPPGVVMDASGRLHVRAYGRLRDCRRHDHHHDRHHDLHDQHQDYHHRLGQDSVVRRRLV